MDDTWGTAQRIRAGELSPVEAVDDAIARIEKLNPELNAVIVERFERARAEAADPSLPDGPLRGVPYVLKDLEALLAGEPHAGGIRAAKEAGFVPTEDALLVERLRAAGAICVGKSNTPELGLIPTTEPLAWGPTRNPHDTGRSAGGSSGGSGAAVAAGMVPFGHGNDGGGSVRIPAARCGLVGLKPSRGRIPEWPEAASFWDGLVAQGVLTRSARDHALLYDVLAGPATGDVHTPADLPADDRPLRVGLLTHVPAGGVDTEPACVAAAERAAHLLEAAGHHVEPAHPAALADEAVTTWFLPCYGAWTAHDLDVWGERIGRAVTSDDVEPLTWAIAGIGRAVTGVQYYDSIQRLRDHGRRVQQWWDEGWDLLVTPTTPDVPPPLGTFDSPPDNPLQGAFRAAITIAYTVPFNISGQPAVSLPVHTTDEGLPVGAQLVTRYGADRLLLRLAEELSP